MPNYIRPVPGGKTIGEPYSGSHGGSAPRNWESRNAVDIAVPKGTPVYAVTDGVIGSQIGSLHSTDPKMQGLRLHLVVAGNEFYYTHLSKLSVKAGEHVRAGQLLGYSGVANGVAHLHFAQKVGSPNDVLGGTAPDPAAAQQSGDAAQPYGVAGATQTATQPPGGTDVRQAPAPDTGAYSPPTLLPPGSGPQARQVAEWWQQIASQQGASPETQSWASNVSASTGG